MPLNPRIAVSVFFGLLTVALCVLWVRSYWQVGVLTYTEGQDVILRRWGFNSGRFIHTKYPLVNKLMDPQAAALTRQVWPAGWSIDAGPAKDLSKNFVWEIGDKRSVVIAPLWPIVLLSAVTCVIAGQLPTFSLRTLLIATTLVAVVLGLGVWLTH